MKIYLVITVILMTACAHKSSEFDSEKRADTIITLKELPLTFDLPDWGITDMRVSTITNAPSPVSDRLLASGLFEDPVGFLKNPLYNNWKAVGPVHHFNARATLVEISFNGPRPRWFTYEIAEEILSKSQRFEWLGFHDLVNLVAKYGDELPSDVPIVGLGSITAYRSFQYMKDMNVIESPTVIKMRGRWALWDLRILYDRSVPDRPYHSPLFLVDTSKEAKPASTIKMTLPSWNVSDQ